MNRRSFIKAAGLSTLGAALMPNEKILSAATTNDKPNVLLIITDQHAQQAISHYGCKNLSTPAIDSIAAAGVSLHNTYCSFPVCGPSRASLFSGKMPSEIGIEDNFPYIPDDLVSLPEHFRSNGYDTVLCGKWHLPNTYERIVKGFDVIPAGIIEEGLLGDIGVTNAAENFIYNRESDRPFFLNISFMQPHDICEWVRCNRNESLSRDFKDAMQHLPSLPPNFHVTENDPRTLAGMRKAQVVTENGYGPLEWSDKQWRKYLYIYFRMVEEIDSEILKILLALKVRGYLENTLIVYTSDHGESMGAHHFTVKSKFLEECAKVPMIFSWPGHLPMDTYNKDILSTNIDIYPTLCALTGLPIPGQITGKDLTPYILKNKDTAETFGVSELESGRRMYRYKQYKYVSYSPDDLDQLFDIEQDPYEMKNLAVDPAYKAIMEDIKKRLGAWEKSLIKRTRVAVKPVGSKNIGRPLANQFIR